MKEKISIDKSGEDKKNTEKTGQEARIVSLFGGDLSGMAKQWEESLLKFSDHDGFKLEYKMEHLFITKIFNKLGEEYEITVKRKGNFRKINVTNVAHKSEYFYETEKIIEENMADEIKCVMSIVDNDILLPNSMLEKTDLTNIDLDDRM